MLVVTDINDIFLPLPDDMLVNLADSRSVVESLLNKLPNMFPGTQNAEAATGVALKAAFEVVV
jgi:protein transport protein SEC24